jgi:uncharacterized repeat protein (TIGR03806 family)
MSKFSRTMSAKLLMLCGFLLTGCGGGSVDTVPPTISLPSLTITDASTVEGNAGTTELIFTVTLDKTTTQTVTVDYATADGTAVSPADYTSASGTLTIPAGTSSANIIISIQGDTTNEADETFTVTLSKPTFATLGSASATGTILNDDAIGGATRVNVVGASVLEGDNGTTNLAFTVNLNGPASNVITVDYATADNSATAGADYVAASNTLTFNVGQTMQTVNIQVNGDTQIETDETFTLALSNPTGGITLGTATATGTILNDDVPVIGVSDASVVEGNSGTRNLTFTVSLNAAGLSDVTVSYSTSDGTATVANLDYLSASGTLTFAPGETSKTVSVTVNGDTDIEPDENFSFNLSNALGAAIAIASATGTITNDDLPTMTISRAGIFEGNSATRNMPFTVNLSRPTYKDVTVDYATSDLSATAGTDYTAVNGTLTIPAGAIAGTIMVSVMGDTDVEPDEEFNLALSNASGANIGVSNAIGTITNDDGPFGMASSPSNTTCLAGDRPSSINPVIELRRAYPNLTFPGYTIVGMTQPPGDNSHWYVLNRNGIISSFVNDAATSTYTTFLDISSKVNAQGEGGLLGMAFHPNYATNGYVYVYYTETGNPLTSILSRFTLNGTTLDPASEVVLLTIPQPFDNHNGGNIAFDQDGYLRLGLGDGGSGGDPYNNGQNTQTLLGSMLRIDVNAATPPYYSIPADNPFQGNALCTNGTGSAACPELYAWGFRNPWRWSFDRSTGQQWVGDVGQNTWEEIDLVQRGNNYGWRCYEGNHAYNTAGCLDISQYVFPITEYDHSLGNAVTGGYVYRGSDPSLASMVGSYIYGDWGTGTIWKITDPYTNPVNEQLTTLAGGGLVSFAEDVVTGELFALNMNGGTLYRFVETSGGGTAMDPLLSHSGCADSTDPKLATSGMIPYDVNSPLWSDNALKKRWFAIPDGAQISILPNGDWQFPIGSVLRKDFYLGTQIVETRLLKRHTDGGWGGYSFQWNAAGTEATLLSGDTPTVVNVAGQEWTYPSQAQCFQCHTSDATFTLGPETAQLNKNFDYSGTLANQVMTYANIGLFDTALPETAFKIADYHDSVNYSVTERARSYLHANCSNCHRPGGQGRGPADMRFSRTFNEMNVCNVDPVAGNLGIPNAKLLVPGIPTESIISIRMHAIDNTRMPLIGTSIVDTFGTQLIDQWITDITSCY